jgi:hypothetical protein
VPVAWRPNQVGMIEISSANARMRKSSIVDAQGARQLTSLPIDWSREGPTLVDSFFVHATMDGPPCACIAWLMLCRSASS